jgi:hypothetical protein
VPHIRLHDYVRHTYAIMAQDAGHNVKTLSERIGHADLTITQKIHTHRTRGVDRPLAQAMGDLIARAAGLSDGQSVPLVTDLVTRRLERGGTDDDDSPAATG